jgi:hypothetical protein
MDLSAGTSCMHWAIEKDVSESREETIGLKNHGRKYFFIIMHLSKF